MEPVKVRWIEKSMMVATDSHGHSVVVGRSPDPGFERIGVKPSDLLIMSAAACSAHDVVEILRKQREPFSDLTILCTGEQLPDPPYSFTSIHLKYIVYGEVNPEKVGKAIRLSEDKYCSVISTLRLGIPVTSEFEIKEHK